jgi:hypothetical protein
MIDTQKLRNSIPYNTNYSVLLRTEFETVLDELDALRKQVAELTADRGYLYNEMKERNDEHTLRY